MIDTADTIAAIASPPGRAHRAIARLAGPGVTEILDRLLDPPLGPAAREAGARPVRLRLPPCRPAGPAPTLPGLLLLARAPRSYTAQDGAELLVPGHPRLAERVLDALLDAGARRATPGEFSARAHLAGRLSLEQAEGVARLIAAERDDELAAARTLLSGQAGRRHAEMADRLAGLLALVEAGIDFTDQEDVVAITPADLDAGLAALQRDLAEALGSDDHTAREAEPVAVLAGPPNAGKSTLFNALLGRPRAVVADRPGTTRDAIAEPLDLSDQHPGMRSITLVDLAGLGETADEADEQAQRLARDQLARADLIIACDPQGRFDQGTHATTAAAAVLRVRTMADRVLPDNAATPSPGAQPHHGPRATPVCALDGTGLPVLRRAIADAALGVRSGGSAALVPRHRRALAQAMDAVADARQSASEPELAAGAMRTALDALGELTGRLSPDDVIGRVFATFCVGK